MADNDHHVHISGSCPDPYIQSLLANNAQFAASAPPALLSTCAQSQHPKVLWIGCADSRVPPTTILDQSCGDIFVHRNIANVVVSTDMNCLSVVQYAVAVLKVEHIIVCGHTSCGGVAAALSDDSYGLLDNWLRNIKDVALHHRAELDTLSDQTAKETRLIELNVSHSVHKLVRTTIVQDAWKAGQKLIVHGWVYNVASGRVQETGVHASGLEDVDKLYVYGARC